MVRALKGRPGQEEVERETVVMHRACIRVFLRRRAIQCVTELLLYRFNFS